MTDSQPDLEVSTSQSYPHSGNIHYIESIARTRTAGDISLCADGEINTGNVTSTVALGSGNINLNRKIAEVNIGSRWTQEQTLYPREFTPGTLKLSLSHHSPCHSRRI
ncbi:hypothetical protein NG796_16530 [Laspinema sp. A4]|uniref:hypothetical protein n=1 Tax=Laspinema sp. D2d TaxID=2953686 RepID=UPI0021BAC046|nr:hypothetical protein [Laspinema sp. D2d]MCT7984878.1 hypothetical protein [Laspinema sp. D2d]